MITNFTLLIEDRYGFGNVKDYFSNDYNLLNDLSNEIDEILKDKIEFTLADFLLKELNIKIEEICVRLK